MINTTLRTRTFAPARTELSYIFYLEYPIPTIDCMNFLIEGDRITGGLTIIRYSGFWFSYNFFRILKGRFNHLGFKVSGSLWKMWNLHPYIGKTKIMKAKNKTLFLHSMKSFDDSFDSQGML